MVVFLNGKRKETLPRESPELMLVRAYKNCQRFEICGEKELYTFWANVYRALCKRIDKKKE